MSVGYRRRGQRDACQAHPGGLARRGGPQEVPLGAVHRIVARDPPLGLALLRGLHDWETADVVSGVWVTSRHFRPGEWARMHEVGYAGGEDEGLWGSMRGDGVSDGEQGGGGGGVHHHRAKTPPQAKPHLNPPHQPPQRNESFPSGRPTRVTMRRSPVAKSPKPPPPPSPARPTKAVPAPKPAKPPQDHHHPPRPPPPPTKTDTPKTDDRPGDPIVGTVAHVPYPTGVEKGTIHGIHGRNYGAVWVEYPGGTTLYEVSRHLLFPTPEEAERYREEARVGKKKPKPPAPSNKATNPPKASPTTEPTNPTNPTNPPSGPAKMWEPTTGSHEV